MKLTIALLVCSLAVTASEHPFAGHWTMFAEKAPGPRVFALDIEPAQPIQGTFFGATGGRLSPLLDVETGPAGLTFRVERVFEGRKPRRTEAVTSLRLKGEAGIEGTTRIDGVAYRWTGWRAPAITEKDDGKWREKPTQPLLESFQPWKATRPGDWKLENGVLENKNGSASLLISRESYWNFKLHLEFKLQRGGNSGIGLRHHYELQLADDYGFPPDLHGNASIYSRIKPVRNASKPAGEWQTLDVTLIGRYVTVILNGEKVIEGRKIPNVSGLALDPYEDRPGPISLQGDHGPVAFRKVAITPLSRR